MKHHSLLHKDNESFLNAPFKFGFGVSVSDKALRQLSLEGFLFFVCGLEVFQIKLLQPNLRIRLQLRFEIIT